MLLDLRTIYVVGALTLLVLGFVQLAACATGRFQRWSAWWSMANILLGIGTGFIALRDMVPDVVSVDLGNTSVLAGYIFMLVAVRVFAGRPVDLRWCGLAILAGGLAYVLLMNNGPTAAGRIAFGSAISALLDLAILREGVRLARREGLRSGWFLAVLFLPTAVLFGARAVLSLTGQMGGEGLFADGAGMHAWLATLAVMFIMMRSLVMMLMASERSYNELAERAHRDPLTEALNRAGLARSFALLADAPQAVLVIDIDHFKALNDRYGHAAGDDILRTLAASARAQLRAGDLFARHGGDEFVAVIGNASVGQAVQVAERIRQSFAKAVAERELAIRPTLSIGVARYLPGRSGFEDILQKADEALYRSKRQGRDRVVTHEDAVLAA
ncbi:diguanylate cyclase [Devosia geojensis]|uniref:diguanylate cyclase n=1 Tax=Devosia geojensis TaxID=443610 RepID=A0A0F5FZX5_9HYPH|nr:GGDEF domain-containing protein [Devosia geojensis]KKB13752.1 diguanylate cyclase [Devosia geojensis]